MMSGKPTANQQILNSQAARRSQAKTPPKPSRKERLKTGTIIEMATGTRYIVARDGSWRKQ